MKIIVKKENMTVKEMLNETSIARLCDCSYFNEKKLYRCDEDIAEMTNYFNDHLFSMAHIKIEGRAEDMSLCTIITIGDDILKLPTRASRTLFGEVVFTEEERRIYDEIIAKWAKDITFPTGPENVFDFDKKVLGIMAECDDNGIEADHDEICIELGKILLNDPDFNDDSSKWEDLCQWWREFDKDPDKYTE